MLSTSSVITSRTWRPLARVKSAACLRRGGEQAEPPGAVALGADFVAAQQVALGDDAREVTGLVDHEQAGDVPGQHQVDGFLYRRFWSDGNAVAGHDVGDDH